MFSIAPPEEPRWVDLPHGVRVEVRPADGLVRAAAEAAVLREVRAQEAERAARLEEGADTADLLDLADPDLRTTFLVLGIAGKLARFAIIRWEGIEQAHTPDLAEAMMVRHPDMGLAFLDALMGPAQKVTEEGNASAPAPNGFSAGAPITAGAADHPAAQPARPRSARRAASKAPPPGRPASPPSAEDSAVPSST
jgi:hypothetical protein